MSTDNWDNDESENEPADKRVTDESGTVDEKIKNRIIETRRRCAEREDQVYVEAPLDPEVNLTTHEQNQIWATSVRQYLRAIEPLLKSDDIQDSEKYYQQIRIPEEPVYLPDGEYPRDPDATRHYYEWSIFYREGANQTKYVREHPKLGRGFEPPEPKRAELWGLKDVIETKELTFEWTITLNPDAIPPQQEMLYPSLTTPLRKAWLEKAVRVADDFLQQAGVGLEIGHAQTDDPDNDPF